MYSDASTHAFCLNQENWPADAFLWLSTSTLNYNTYLTNHPVHMKETGTAGHILSAGRQPLCPAALRAVPDTLALQLHRLCAQRTVWRLPVLHTALMLSYGSDPLQTHRWSSLGFVPAENGANINIHVRKTLVHVFSVTYDMGMSLIHQVWPKPFCKEEWQGEEDKTEENVGRQYQGMDRPGVCQVPKVSWEQRKMKETGCEVICGAQTTLMVKNRWRWNSNFKK